MRRQLVLEGSTGGRVQAVGSRSTEQPSAQEGSLSSLRPSGTPTVPRSPKACDPGLNPSGSEPFPHGTIPDQLLQLSVTANQPVSRPQTSAEHRAE